jgi:Domain of unknown function (DUF4263)
MQVGVPFIDLLRVHYWLKLRELATKDSQIRAQMPGMILAPDKVTFYLGRTHVAVEYSGPMSVPEAFTKHDRTTVAFVDSREEEDLLESIIGMKFYATGIKVKTDSGYYVNFFLPTSASTTALLMKNGWDVTAEDMNFGLNTKGILISETEFARAVNCFFYAVDQGRLRTRRLQWIDFFPIAQLARTETEDTITEEVRVNLWPNLPYVIEHDSHFQFPSPETFEHVRLALLNRFRELLLEPGLTEPRITAWLAKPAHQFILRMALAATGILYQKKCEWKTDPSRPAIMPDFFAVKSNGYADIVEFKLPTLKGSATVGLANREAFSAEMNSYIAQTRCYKEYFQESEHRKLVQKLHGLKVDNPARILIIGRRWEFGSAELRRIQAEFSQLTILTYDDLIDSVAALLYHNPKLS